MWVKERGRDCGAKKHIGQTERTADIRQGQEKTSFRAVFGDVQSWVGWLVCGWEGLQYPQKQNQRNDSASSTVANDAYKWQTFLGKWIYAIRKLFFPYLLPQNLLLLLAHWLTDRIEWLTDWHWFILRLLVFAYMFSLWKIIIIFYFVRARRSKIAASRHCDSLLYCMYSTNIK